MIKKPRYSNKSAAYATSTDYTRLKQLLDNGATIVAFVDYAPPDVKDYVFQDICIGTKINSWYQFGVRGICYLSWYSDLPFSFEDMCAANGVEYIEPTKKKV